jgi:hypothetical protein
MSHLKGFLHVGRLCLYKPLRLTAEALLMQVLDLLVVERCQARLGRLTNMQEFEGKPKGMIFRRLYRMRMTNTLV